MRHTGISTFQSSYLTKVYRNNRQDCPAPFHETKRIEYSFRKKKTPAPSFLDYTGMKFLDQYKLPGSVQAKCRLASEFRSPVL